MKNLIETADRFAGLLSLISALFAAVLAAFIVLATVMRYFLGAPLSFTEELVGLLFISMIFCGLPSLTLRGQHVAVTLIAENMRPWMSELMARLAAFGTLIFCLWFGYLAWDYLQTTLMLHARTAGTRLILWPWVAVMPLSCALSALAATIRIFIPVHPAEDAEEGAI